jgi:predicted CXXCH cytochrome family protein
MNMKLFSKKVLLLVSVATGVFISSFAAAAVTSKVVNTKHNFTTSNNFKADPASGMTQVCVFCHTPHNAGQTKLLWNKANNSTPNFRLYTSSGSLTNQTRKFSTLPAGSPSLLCLGCHDGVTAMNILHTSSSGVDAASNGAVGYPAGAKLIPVQSQPLAPFAMPAPTTDMFSGISSPDMRIGGGAAGGGTNLTDDHPIGFSYSAVISERAAAPGGLHTLDDAKNAGIRFFDNKTELNRVECSSCHDPHIDTTTDSSFWPFLVKSNTGSALCLSCHDK